MKTSVHITEPADDGDLVKLEIRQTDDEGHTRMRRSVSSFLTLETLNDVDAIRAEHERLLARLVRSSTPSKAVR